MNTDVLQEIISKPASRDRYVSVILYLDRTALISISSNGSSFTIHLSKEDVSVIVNALTCLGATDVK